MLGLRPSVRAGFPLCPCSPEQGSGCGPAQSLVSGQSGQSWIDVFGPENAAIPTAIKEKREKESNKNRKLDRKTKGKDAKSITYYYYNKEGYI